MYKNDGYFSVSAWLSCTRQLFNHTNLGVAVEVFCGCG